MSYPKRYDALPCETIRDDDENAIHPMWEKEGERAPKASGKSEEEKEKAFTPLKLDCNIKTGHCWRTRT